MLRSTYTSAAILVALSLSPSTSAADPRAIVFPGETWEEVSPLSQGVDPALLGDAVRFLEENSGSNGARELVIVRNGRVIFRGRESDRVHGVWSVTKSFTSTVLGLLVDDGKCEIQKRAAKFAPALEADYRDVRIEHFATMTSGYRAKGDEPKGSYTHGPSATPFEPSPSPLFSPPGSHFAYWDSAMNELALVVTKIAGESLEDIFRRRVAEPIGLRSWKWGDFGEIDGVRVNGGSGNHGKHVEISALGLARLGLLFLERGRWDGTQLLSESWIDEATRVHVPPALPLGHPESGIDGRGVYGLNWWVNGITATGRRLWPGAPAGTFAASGYNNNDLFVVPAWNLVVARLGLDESDRKITDEVYGEFLRRIGAAIFARSELRGRGWHPASARDEIAPIAWIDETETFDGKPSLALAGNGQDSTDGRWTREVEIQAGETYRFASRYETREVDEPLRSVLARVIWRDADGNVVERPEYPRTVSEDGGSAAIEDVYLAPEGATHAVLELVLRWDGDGVARFAEPRFERADPPAPRKVRLAAVHHRPRGVSSAREALESFAPFVAKAGAKHADFVCLPEGITIVGTRRTYAEVAEPIPGPSTARLGELAREHSLWIVAGIYERDGTAIYNTAVLIDSRGKLAGKYRKVCLPREEIDGGITPGDELPVFDTPFGRVGLMICWDVFFPEPARELAKKGAEIIFLPIWGGDLTLARARAIENQVYLVSSTYDMKTAVFDRRGEIVAEGTESDPVILVEVDLAERTLWPWLGDFRSRIPREMATRSALVTFGPPDEPAGSEKPRCEVVIGEGGRAGGKDAKIRLERPFGIGFDARGNATIVELEGGRVHRFTPEGELTTIAGDGSSGFSGDGGPAKDATFNGMHNIAVTRGGDIYISDAFNHRVRRIDGATGTISTFAGTGERAFAGDGGPADRASFDHVMCVALAPGEKELFVADLGNRRIRAIDLETREVRTVAGNGEKSAPKDGAPALESPLVDPRAVAVDSKRNIYILERSGHALRVVRPDGTIHTVVNASGKPGDEDGPALEARLRSPKHIAIDGDDRVLIADDQNGLIRRYDPRTERVSTILGRDDGVKLENPHGVCFHDGDVWVADSSHGRILRVRR